MRSTALTALHKAGLHDHQGPMSKTENCFYLQPRSHWPSKKTKRFQKKNATEITKRTGVVVPTRMQLPVQAIRIEGEEVEVCHIDGTQEGSTETPIQIHKNKKNRCGAF